MPGHKQTEEARIRELEAASEIWLSEGSGELPEDAVDRPDVGGPRAVVWLCRARRVRQCGDGFSESSHGLLDGDARLESA